MATLERTPGWLTSDPVSLKAGRRPADSNHDGLAPPPPLPLPLHQGRGRQGWPLGWCLSVALPARRAAAIGVHLHGLVSPELCLLWGWRRPGGGQRSVRGHAGVVSV